MAKLIRVLGESPPCDLVFNEDGKMRSVSEESPRKQGHVADEGDDSERTLHSGLDFRRRRSEDIPVRSPSSIPAPPPPARTRVRSRSKEERPIRRVVSLSLDASAASRARLRAKAKAKAPPTAVNVKKFVLVDAESEIPPVPPLPFLVPSDVQWVKQVGRRQVDLGDYANVAKVLREL